MDWFTIGSYAAAVLGGAVVNGKFIVPRIHRMGDSWLKTVLMVTLDGGPGIPPK